MKKIIFFLAVLTSVNCFAQLGCDQERKNLRIFQIYVQSEVATTTDEKSRLFARLSQEEQLSLMGYKSGRSLIDSSASKQSLIEEFNTRYQKFVQKCGG